MGSAVVKRRKRPRPLTPAQDALFTRYTPYALGIAKRFEGLWPGGLEDLRQEAKLALVKAVRRWQPDRGTRFESYASLVIGGAVIDACRRSHPMTGDPLGRHRAQGTARPVVTIVSLDALLELAVSDGCGPVPSCLADRQLGPEDLALARERAGELLDQLAGDAVDKFLVFEHFLYRRRSLTQQRRQARLLVLPAAQVQKRVRELHGRVEALLAGEGVPA